MTYTRMKRQIERGAYDRETALEMLDAFMMAGRITVAQYNELVGMLPVAE